MKKIILCFSLIFISSFSYCQVIEKFDTLKCKMKLTEYMMACHASIVSALREKDGERKMYLGDKASEYINLAKEQFNLLKGNISLDEELNKNISDTIDEYYDILNDPSNLSKPEIAFALQLMESVYKRKILKQLWK